MLLLSITVPPGWWQFTPYRKASQVQVGHFKSLRPENPGRHCLRNSVTVSLCQSAVSLWCYCVCQSPWLLSIKCSPLLLSCILLFPSFVFNPNLWLGKIELIFQIRLYLQVFFHPRDCHLDLNKALPFGMQCRHRIQVEWVVSQCQYTSSLFQNLPIFGPKGAPVP